MTTDREELRRYEADLHEAEQEFAAAQAKVENLRLIVQGMRGLLGASPDPPRAGARVVVIDSTDHLTGDDTVTAEAVRDAAIASYIRRRAAQSGGSKMTYGGRASIPAVIFDVLDHKEAGLDDIYAAICAHDAYEGRKKPSRGSVTNRLNEMADRGEIIKVRRGVYKSLPPGHGGTENPAESGGGPNPAQLEVGTAPR